MAYAALRSLTHAIRGILSSCRILGASTRESLQSALDRATSLEDTLECCSGMAEEMDERIIIEESRKLEDAIEFPVPTHFLEPAFPQLRQDVDCFAKIAMKMEANIEESRFAKLIEDDIMELCVPKKPSLEEDEEEEGSSMVGLSDQFLQIRDQISATERSKNPVYIQDIIIWISGMAGIGKTRLVKKLFDDPSVKASFECRAFVRTGREYVAFDSEKRIMEGDDESFWRVLTDRKSLVVLDDVREEHPPLHKLHGLIKEYKGSWILVTSRINAIHYPLLKMRFLNEEESWELLRMKVFGKEEKCPPLLVEPGKKIAEKCEGLPLLIIAAAPILLSKAQKNVDDWKRVAEKPNSVLEEASYQISEVLLSNYHYLTEEEKLCFLYIVAFPQTYVVQRTTIRHLWYAEGFLFDWYHAFIDNFNVYIKNNLAIGSQKRFVCYGDVLYKACRLHTAYWHVSRRLAENNKFLYTISTPDDGLDERVNSHRRLAIYNSVLLSLKELHDFMESVSTVRTLLCTGPYHQYQVPLCWEWKLLRVLSALTIRFYEFPVEVVKLVCLKYLALTCNSNLPPSISELWNLRFLIVHQHSSIKRVGVELYLPVEVWGLQELELLHIVGKNLPDPPHAGAVLPKLTKLLGVGVESCTKGVLESLPVLEKLRIQIELAPHAAETAMSFFDHLPCPDGLLSFHSVVMNPAISHPPPPLSIPMFDLHKLTLSGFGYPWEDMSKIAQLPTLRKLKLKCYAFRGEKWEAEGMRFKSLEHLMIEDTDLVQWTARDETFPKLGSLTMKNCHKLREIPLLAPRYRTVEIELVDCNPSAETCTKLRYITRDDERCKVSASYSWNEEKKIESR